MNVPCPKCCQTSPLVCRVTRTVCVLAEASASEMIAALMEMGVENSDAEEAVAPSVKEELNEETSVRKYVRRPPTRQASILNEVLPPSSATQFVIYSP